MPLFYLSPSRIGRFFYHECERYLRYHATPRERRKTDGIPRIEWDTSPVTAAILEGGFAWEREIIQKKLKGRVRVASGEGPVNERAHDVKQSISLLQTLKLGEAVYQPTFKAPDSFLKRYNVPSDLCELPPCRPDLLHLVESNGTASLKVIDVKASTGLKVSHRIQVAMYALIMRDVIENHCPGIPIDMDKGGVWLYGYNEPEWFDLRFSLETLEEFLGSRLMWILTLPIEELQWHLFFRCEWCEFYNHCREEADSKRSVSLIPYLSRGGRRYLREAPWDGTSPINTLSELENFLANPDADRCLEACGSLKSKGDRLRNAVTALNKNEVVHHGGYSLALPIMENVALFVTLQDDPVTGHIYVAGFRRLKGKDVFGEGIREEIFIAETPEDCGKIRKTFLTGLYKELKVLHDFNKKRQWPEQKSMQTYVYDSYELSLFNRLLQESLLDPELSELAVQLLFHFQDTSLAEADEHPVTEIVFPVIVITDVIRQLLALPVPVSLRLPDVLKVLPSPTFEYQFEPSSLFWFELSNVLKSDSIFMVWNKGRKEALKWIHDEMLRRLRATSAVLDGLREKIKDHLIAWPPRFLFPASLDFNYPELSRLAFITRYESLLGAIEIRTKRSLPWSEREREGTSIPVKKEDADRWKVLSEIDQGVIEEGGDFFTFLLVPDSEEGERAQLSYDDYRRRKEFWAPSGLVWLARIYDHQVDPQTGLVTYLSLELKENKDLGQYRRGARAVLHPRFTDFTSDWIVQQLSAIDEMHENEFVQLLRSPDKFSSSADKFPNITDKALKVAADFAGFTASQLNAFRNVLEKRLTLVWGPPGTGKTHFLAKTILGMAKTAMKDGKPFQIAVAAFTHAAVENLLAEIRDHAATFGLDRHLNLYKLKKVSTPRGRDLTVLAEREAGRSFNQQLLVIGGTVYGLYKAGIGRHFPLLLVDEASQMKFGELAMAMSVMAPGGKLVLTGDDLQLPPILKGVYPEPEDGLPGLQSSVFAYLRARDNRTKPYTCQITENWRMNNTLSQFPAETLYGTEYQPVNEEVANQKVSLLPIPVRGLNTSEIDICEWLTDPEFPMVTCVLEGVQATIENPLEAELVAKLSFFLRTKLCKAESGTIYPDAKEGDWEFWRRGLFIVSPHHVQIRAILRELSGLRRWKSPAFVDTVDKMQGQQSQCVIVSYGVSDIETALSEAEFIYSLNRINVSVSRAQSKCIVFLPLPLLEPSFDVLQNPKAVKGLEHMHALLHFCKSRGEKKEFTLDFLNNGNGGRLTAYRAR